MLNEPLIKRRSVHEKIKQNSFIMANISANKISLHQGLIFPRENGLLTACKIWI